MANLPLKPSLTDAFESIKSNIFANLHCHNIGRIVEYDSTTNTATIETMLLKEFYTKTIYPSLITNVPIVTFGTKNARITMPNPVGCHVVLLFMDRNIDNFLITGEQHLPSTDRMHSISDCVALLTINTEVDEAVMYDENALTLNNHSASIQLFDDDKIRIANMTQNLATLIQAFLTACENIQTITNTGLLTESSKQAFTDLKTQFEELLK